MSIKSVNLLKGDNIKLFEYMIDNNIKANIVYFDPPYNTGNSKLTYKDSFAQSEWDSFITKRIEYVDKIMDKDSFLYVSIGNEEFAEIKMLIDKVIGKKNFVAMLPRKANNTSKTTNLISKNNDWLLIWKKGKAKFKGITYEPNAYKLKDEYFDERGAYQLRRLDYKDFAYSQGLDYLVKINGQEFWPGGIEKRHKRECGEIATKDWCWLWKKDRVKFAIDNDFIVVKNGHVYKKTYWLCKLKFIKGEWKVKPITRTKPIPSNHFMESSEFQVSYNNTEYEKLFTYCKSKGLLKFLIGQPRFKTKIILDPFAGSGTTAIAAKDIRGVKGVYLAQLPEKLKQHNDLELENIADLTSRNLEEYGLSVNEIKGDTNE